MDATVGISLAALAITGVVWAVRQEGRINGHDTRLEQLREDSERRHGELRDDMRSLRSELHEIGMAIRERR